MLCQNLVLIFGMPRQSTSLSSPTQSRAFSAEEDPSGNVSFDGGICNVPNARSELAMHNNSYTSLWRRKYEVCMVDKACQLLFPRKPLTQLQRQTPWGLCQASDSHLLSARPLKSPRKL